MRARRRRRRGPRRRRRSARAGKSLHASRTPARAAAKKSRWLESARGVTVPDGFFDEREEGGGDCTKAWYSDGSRNVARIRQGPRVLDGGRRILVKRRIVEVVFKPRWGHGGFRNDLALLQECLYHAETGGVLRNASAGARRRVAGVDGGRGARRRAGGRQRGTRSLSSASQPSATLIFTGSGRLLAGSTSTKRFPSGVRS